MSEDFLKVSDGIVGTCQEVERRYVRVTSQPDPRTVRPEPVLREALARVQERERKGRDYEECQDLYMSICQDLRLQQLDGPLAIEVRESFAQCAMRARTGPPDGAKGMDVKALSDSLLHLQALYAQHPGQPRELEFALYRMLLWLALAQDAGPEQQTGWVSLAPATAALLPHRAAPLARFGLDVLAAVTAADSARYFALAAVPPVGAAEARHILETLLTPPVRARAYAALLKAYKMKFPCGALQRRLGLPSREAAAAWARARGGVLVADGADEALDLDAFKASKAPA